MIKKTLARNNRLRSVLSFVVAAVMIGSISYLGVKTYHDSHAASGASIYVNPSSGTLTSGTTVSITIRENSGTDPVNSVQASLNYDSNALQYSSITEGGSFPVIAATSTGTPGVVRVGRANADNPVTGDLPVVTVNFKVIGTSGTGTIVVDKAYSFLVRSTDNQDILQSVGNGSYTIASSGAPVLYVSPSSGIFSEGSTLSATIRLNSASNAVSTVESVVGYPTSQLQYVSVSEGGVYTTQQRTRNANGVVDIIRGIAGGSSGVTGDNSLVTINFKVIGTGGSAALTINDGSAVYDASGTGSNILDSANSAGAAYTISASGGSTPPPSTPPPSPPPPPSGGADGGNGSTVNAPGGLTVTTKRGGHVSLGTSNQGVVTELQGQVTLSPSIATDGVTAISKVEYYLDSKLLSTQTAAPYTYNFDSTKQRNGIHTLLIKVYFSNGTVDTKTSRLSLKNKITLSYVLRQYAPSALVLIAILAVCVFLILKLVIPRFAFARHHTTNGGVDYDVIHGSSDISAAHSPVMADPVVVAPTNSTASPTNLAAGSAQVDKAPQTTEPQPAPASSNEPTIIRPTIITPDSDTPPKL